MSDPGALAGPRAVVLGATGYVATRLIPTLVDAGVSVTALVRTPSRLDASIAGRVRVVEGDAGDPDALASAIGAGDVVYHLIHSMTGSDFAEVDARIARAVAEAAERAEARRVVYLGGLHPQGVRLSEHLRSRTQVGEILLGGRVPAAVLNASVIVGAGSASFEMIRHLTRNLPAMVAPTWLNNRVEPIGIRDVVHYLIHVRSLAPDVDRAFDIGSGDVRTYRELIETYAHMDDLPQRPIVTIPAIPPRLASLWVRLVTPLPGHLSASLVDSLVHETVCDEDDITDLVPPPPGGLQSYEAATAIAIERPPRRPACDLKHPGHPSTADAL